MVDHGTAELFTFTYKHAKVSRTHQPDGAVLLRPTDHQDRGLLLPQRAEWVGLAERERRRISRR